MNIQNEIKTSAISSLSKLLTNKDVWNKVLTQVYTLEDSTLSGPERKALAIKYLKEDLIDISTLLLNAILELAVLFIRLKANKI